MTWSLSILIYNRLETEEALCQVHNWVWHVKQRPLGSLSVASPQHNNIRLQNHYFIFQALFQRRETRLVKWLTARQSVTRRWQISARTTDTEMFACNDHIDGDVTDVLMDCKDKAQFEWLTRTTEDRFSCLSLPDECIISVWLEKISSLTANYTRKLGKLLQVLAIAVFSDFWGHNPSIRPVQQLILHPGPQAPLEPNPTVRGWSKQQPGKFLREH